MSKYRANIRIAFDLDDSEMTREQRNHLAEQIASNLSDHMHRAALGKSGPRGELIVTVGTQSVRRSLTKH